MSATSTAPSEASVGHLENHIVLADSEISTTSASGFTTGSQEWLRIPARKRVRDKGEKQTDEVQVSVQDYGVSCSSSIRVEAVSATLAWKGEDRHIVHYSNCVGDDDAQETAFKQVAFVGVFDGHDGPQAAQYCAEGLLPHVLIEMNKELRGKNESPKKACGENVSSWKSHFEPIYCRAFQNAHKQFAETGKPPCLDDVLRKRSLPPIPERPYPRRSCSPPEQALSDSKQPEDRKRHRFFHWKSPKTNRKKFKANSAQTGGTTACTLSIVSPNEF